MDKEKLNELKNKAINATKEEFSNMKSVGTDIKDAIKNKNFDNIKNKDSNGKKKFVFGILGFMVILILVICIFSDEDESSSSTNSKNMMCKGKYYYVERDKGEYIEKCSSKCWYEGKVPLCSWGVFGMETKPVEYFEDRTNY